MSRLAGAGFSYAEQVLEPSLQSSATIFTNEAENEVCVAFRGSTALTNFKSMFALGLVPLSNDNVGNGDGDVPRVHEGYQEASLRLYERLQSRLDSIAGGTQRVIFTGHSYGGGTATLCALYHSPDELMTLSAPLVGDAAFAHRFDAAAAARGARTTHLVHDADPVLQQNRPLWEALGYQHTGQIVRCSPTEALLHESDAAERGGIWPEGGGELAWNFLDHTRYLGTYLGPRVSVGKVRWTRLLKPNYRP